MTRPANRDLWCGLCGRAFTELESGDTCTRCLRSDWYPAEGMTFTSPEGYHVRLMDINTLCRCDECPCWFASLDNHWAGQFSLAELRTMPFAPDNAITEPGPKPDVPKHLQEQPSQLGFELPEKQWGAPLTAGTLRRHDYSREIETVSTGDAL